MSHDIHRHLREVYGPLPQFRIEIKSPSLAEIIEKLDEVFEGIHRRIEEEVERARRRREFEL